MAADSSSDETDAAAPAAEQKPAGLLDKPNGPPRPPRPVRRTSGSLRIPLPSAVTPGSKLSAPRVEPAPTLGLSFTAEPSAEPRSSLGSSVTIEPAVLEPAVREPAVSDPPAPEPLRTMPSPGAPPRNEAQRRSPVLDPQNIPTPLPPLRPSTRPPPAVVSQAVPGEAATNIEFSLTRRSSGAPPLSFDSEDVDPSDRAPVAPLTPWRDVPPLKEAPELSSPAVAAAQAEDDHEETMVGQVPQDLLELSSEEDEEENTRAYQAPQELIDLARREREERRQSQAQLGKKRDAKAAFADSLPPAARAAADLDDDQSDVLTATVPLDTFPASGAAPPVALSGALRGAASGEPSHGRKVSNGPASLEELARAVSGPGERESIPVVSEVLSEDRSPDSLPDFSGGAGRGLTRGRVWALLVGLMLVVGFALARWRGVELPLSR